MRRRHFVQAALAATGANAFAQQKPQGLPGGYPNKPVRVIIGSSPGGGTDVSGRQVIDRLSQRWNHPFVLENVAGANGIVATNMVSKAAPDGYTLMVAANSTLVAADLVNKVGYDVRSAFTTIALFTTQPYMLAVSNSLPVNSLKELIDYIKARPGELNYASSGLGGSSHIGMEQLNLMAGLKTQHIPYKGIAPGITDLIAGRIQLLFGSGISLMPHVRNGRLKAIAVTSAKRSPLMPGLPAVAELVPGFELTGWYGLLGPAGMPPEIVNALNREVGLIVSSPEMVEKVNAQGSEAPQATPAQFKEMMGRELDSVAKVIKDVGLRLEQ